MQTLKLPSYLPNGYSLWTVIQGREAAGFGFVDSDDQFAATYTRAKMPAGKDSALTVFRGPPGANTLAATDLRPGEAVTLSVPGTTAAYHDGMWVLGPGREQRTVHRRTFHWERAMFHSLTVHTSSEVWGIRGPKDGQVDKEQLIRIAVSLLD